MVTLFVTFLYMNLFVSTWQWWATKISVQYIFDASGSFPVFFHAVGSFFSPSRLRDKLRGSMRIARRKLCLRNHIKPRPTSGARYPFPSGSKTHLSCQNIRWSFQSLRSVHLSRIPFLFRILSGCASFTWKNDRMMNSFRSARWFVLEKTFRKENTLKKDSSTKTRRVFWRSGLSKFSI